MQDQLVFSAVPFVFSLILSFITILFSKYKIKPTVESDLRNSGVALTQDELEEVVAVTEKAVAIDRMAIALALTLVSGLAVIFQSMRFKLGIIVSIGYAIACCVLFVMLYKDDPYRIQYFGRLRFPAASVFVILINAIFLIIILLMLMCGI